MYQDEKTLEIKHLIEEYLAVRSIDLVQLNLFRHRGSRAIVRILVDKPEGGISLDDCANLNNDISQLLDNSGIFLESYILEVSSPGLDRPLTSLKDYSRAINRKVRVFLRQPVSGKMELAGTLKKADENFIYLEMDNKEVKIPIENINKAKCVIK